MTTHPTPDAPAPTSPDRETLAAAAGSRERLVLALKEIAYMRPAGDLEKARGLRDLVKRIEQIAHSGLAEFRSAVFRDEGDRFAELDKPLPDIRLNYEVASREELEALLASGDGDPAELADVIETHDGDWKREGETDFWRFWPVETGALLRDQPADGWRTDMENAPRDGTPLDLLFPYPRGRTVNCEWDTGPAKAGWFWRTPQWEQGELLPRDRWDYNTYPNMEPIAWRLADEPTPPDQEAGR